MLIAGRRFGGCDVEPGVEERPVIGQFYVISVEPGSSTVEFWFTTNNDTNEGQGFNFTYWLEGEFCEIFILTWVHS